MEGQMLEKKNYLKCHLRGMSPTRKLTYTPLSCNSAKSQSLKKTLKIGDKNRRPDVSFRGIFKACQVDEVVVFD